MSKKSLASLVIILAMVGAGVWVMNSPDMRDRLQSIGYVASDEVESIKTKLKLTDKADGIFMASRPELDSREDFNYHCSSYDEQISVLGCYTNNVIYVYDIQSDEIDGIRESTMAHELLHAIWTRLDDDEKNTLSPYLWQIYNEHKEMAEDLDIYDEQDRLDELHSRIGTQIADLPGELETHYAKYFKDQDEIVAYYVAYSTPFTKLNTQLEQLSTEMNSMSEEINSKTAEYQARTATLSNEIREFNECANENGCFDVATFYSKRTELIEKQSELTSLYQEINQLIDTYNAKVKEYNSNIVRTQDLQNSINSNSAPPTV